MITRLTGSNICRDGSSEVTIFISAGALCVFNYESKGLSGSRCSEQSSCVCFKMEDNHRTNIRHAFSNTFPSQSASFIHREQEDEKALCDWSERAHDWVWRMMKLKTHQREADSSLLN